MEYQFYEFQAIDRPLTSQEQGRIRKLSSRVEPTPHHAVFTYSYGDFPGDPKKILAEYYDAMLYLANWGSKQLLFRFPKATVNWEEVKPYCLRNCVTFAEKGDFAILDISFGEEGGGEWIEERPRT